MKINVDFELDWINGDDSINEAVQRKIISNIVGGIDEKVKSLIQKEADNALSVKIDTMIDTVLSDFMDRNVIVTDKWGDEISRYESVNELLKEKFDAFMTEGVDSNGKTSGNRQCGYDEKPRVEYLISKYINKRSSEIVSGIEKDIASRFSDRIREAEKNLRLKTVEKYMNTLDFEAGLKARKAA